MSYFGAGTQQCESGDPTSVKLTVLYLGHPAALPQRCDIPDSSKNWHAVAASASAPVNSLSDASHIRIFPATPAASPLCLLPGYSADTSSSVTCSGGGAESPESVRLIFYQTYDNEPTCQLLTFFLFRSLSDMRGGKCHHADKPHKSVCCFPDTVEKKVVSKFLR